MVGNQTWSMDYSTTNGTTWVGVYTINNPKNDISVIRKSNRSKTKLYDGSEARLIPSGTKALYEEVTLEWNFISASNRLFAGGINQISLQSAILLGYRVRFHTHELVEGSASTDQIFEGYLTGVTQIYKLGMFPNAGSVETYFDMSVTFDIITIT